LVDNEAHEAIFSHLSKDDEEELVEVEGDYIAGTVD
jgi:hypothetical protein